LNLNPSPTHGKRTGLIVVCSQRAIPAGTECEPQIYEKKADGQSVSCAATHNLTPEGQVAAMPSLRAGL
jgi:hypothetical protein